jgi:hypothetical protein
VLVLLLSLLFNSTVVAVINLNHAIISRNINAISVLESLAKSTLKPEEYYRIEIDQNAKIKVSKNLAYAVAINFESQNRFFDSLVHF